jgi:hypothetical protein
MRRSDCSLAIARVALIESATIADLGDHIFKERTPQRGSLRLRARREGKIIRAGLATTVWARRALCNFVHINDEPARSYDNFQENVRTNELSIVVCWQKGAAQRGRERIGGCARPESSPGLRPPSPEGRGDFFGGAWLKLDRLALIVGGQQGAQRGIDVVMDEGRESL